MHKKPYTLITGASEGLGKALALECARRGMNLILVALPQSDLENLAVLIRKNFRVSVLIIGKDLSDSASCYQLFEEVNSRHIDLQILINNAGIGSAASFCESSSGFYEKQIGLNVIATTIITRLFLENLERNTPSYILNVGSLASFFSLPKKQVYGATKSYIHYFSKSLQIEVRQKGIRVCVLCPGGINTNLSVTLINRTGSRLSRLAVLSPEEVAATAMNGLLKGRQVIVPGRINKIFMLLDKLLPGSIKTRIASYGMNKLETDNPFLKLLTGKGPEPVYMDKTA
jgi:short-subunit dehydrogenase